MLKLEYVVVVNSRRGRFGEFMKEVTIEIKDLNIPDKSESDGQLLATEHFRRALEGWYGGGVVTKKEYERIKQGVTDILVGEEEPSKDTQPIIEQDTVGVCKKHQVMFSPECDICTARLVNDFTLTYILQPLKRLDELKKVEV